jgi:uncharacterized protein (TIGR03435 family)
MLIATLAALAIRGVWAQPAAGTTTFEVASVKPSPPPDPSTGIIVTSVRGGPGSNDPTRIDYRNISLTGLIGRAYHVNTIWQLSAPEWMVVEKYDVAADVPPGATGEQFRLMLQNLLAERFNLRVHFDTKEMPLYSLTVARSGPKLKAHGEASQPRRDDRMDRKPGMACIQIDDTSLAPLVDYLSGRLEAPVRDDTGLRGRYDIVLSHSDRPPDAPAADDTDPDLFAALQDQLGLKLERKMGLVEILAIDHAEKVPTGN